MSYFYMFLMFQRQVESHPQVLRCPALTFRFTKILLQTFHQLRQKTGSCERSWSKLFGKEAHGRWHHDDFLNCLHVERFESSNFDQFWWHTLAIGRYSILQCRQSRRPWPATRTRGKGTFFLLFPVQSVEIVVKIGPCRQVRWILMTGFLMYLVCLSSNDLKRV